MIYIIGAGGVGSWLTPSLAMLVGPGNITVIDKDVLEVKNLNRQLFTSQDIGKSKAEALADRYQCHHMHSWFSCGLINIEPQDTLMCAVDNHAARVEVLNTCDRDGCLAIIGANETYSAESYVYRPEWSDTDKDPREFYPELLTDKTGDPRRAAIGCTGEAQVQTPQLVTANFMAAALMQHLFITWVFEARKFDKAAREHLPHKLVSNLSKLSSTKAGVPAPITERKANATTQTATATA
jgi:molybdopterin/thiamine biosynthesis adenylyltransferase